MTCRDCESLMSIYVDGELRNDGSRLMFEHLGGCSGCRELLRGFLDLRRTFRADAATAGEEVPSRSGESAMQGVHRSPLPDHQPISRGRSIFKRRVHVPVVSLVALLIGIVVLIGSWIMSGRTPPEKEVIYVTTLPTVEVVSNAQTISGRLP